jgi:hypothetical protein
MAQQKKDRLFTDSPWRHYRRRYSVTEFRIGLGIVGILAAIAVWILVRGQHPDPEIYGEGRSLVKRGARAMERGALPAGLAPKGWKEASASVFGKDNVYEKINGREGFYKSYGFESLAFVTIVDEEDNTRTVDVELFDLGNATNALGCFAGEAPKGQKTMLQNGVLSRRDRNAHYLAKGSFYARSIGSEESPKVTRVLDHLQVVLSAGLEGSDVPWSYALFMGPLGISPSAISYRRENAFSFAFADDVHIARLPDSEAEYFVSARKSATQATKMRGHYIKGFATIGEVVEDKADGGWVKDRYLGQFSGAGTIGRVVVGIRGAEDLARGKKALEALRAALASFEIPDVSQPQAGEGSDPGLQKPRAKPAPPKGEGEGEGEDEEEEEGH